MMDPMDDLWFPDDPSPIVPVPAAQVDGLRGRRVVTGSPDRGWRGDLRADDAVRHGDTDLVPVLVESDWYRAEQDQVEVFAPLVPIERVWVERTGTAPAGGGNQRDLLSRLVTLDAPAPRTPVPARDAPGLTGRRVVVVSPDDQRRDLRAVTEPFQHDDGSIHVRICDESDWYRWAFTGQPARCTEVPVYLVWAE
ncbi:hypothetical protein [Actinocatenispora rupis]